MRGVVREASGGPATGVQVVALWGNAWSTSLVGADGSYELRGSGEITIVAVRPWTDPGAAAFEARCSDASATCPRPEPGASVVYDIQLPRRSIIAGTVRDANGQPAYVNVTASKGGFGFVHYDAFDRYSVTVPPGRYSLHASPARSTIGLDTDLLCHVPRAVGCIDVAEGAVVERDIVLDAAGILEGTVRDVDGNPVRGGSLNTGRVNFPVGDDGTYRVRVPAGEPALLQAQTTNEIGLRPFTIVNHIACHGTEGAPCPLVRAFETTRHDITLPVGGRLVGKVLDEEGRVVRPTGVELRSSERSRSQFPDHAVRVNETGWSALVLPGCYSVTVEVDRVRRSAEACVVAEATRDVEIRIFRSTEVRGRVLLTDGAAASGVNVSVGLGRGVTDERGDYVVRVASAGRHAVTTHRDPSGVLGASGIRSVPDCGPQTACVETGLSATVWQNLTIPRLATLTVRATLPNGTPLARGYVEVEPAEPRPFDGSYTFQTDDNGTLTTTLEPGNYSVSVVRLRDGLVHFACIEAPGCIALGDGATREIDARMPVMRALNGSVLRDGLPVLGARVEARLGMHSFDASPGRDGTFSLRLPEGRYALGARTPFTGAPAVANACPDAWLACRVVDLQDDVVADIALPNVSRATVRLGRDETIGGELRVRIQGAEFSAAARGFDANVTAALPPGTYDVLVEPTLHSPGARCVGCLVLSPGVDAQVDVAPERAVTVRILGLPSETSRLRAVSRLGVHDFYRDGADPDGPLRAVLPAGEARIVGLSRNDTEVLIVDERVTVEPGAASAASVDVRVRPRPGRILFEPTTLRDVHVTIAAADDGPAFALGSAREGREMVRLNATLDGTPLETAFSGRAFVAIAPTPTTGERLWSFDAMTAGGPVTLRTTTVQPLSTASPAPPTTSVGVPATPTAPTEAPIPGPSAGVIVLAIGTAVLLAARRRERT